MGEGQHRGEGGARRILDAGGWRWPCSFLFGGMQVDPDGERRRPWFTSHSAHRRS
jgi:hypothetical protein